MQAEVAPSVTLIDVNRKHKAGNLQITPLQRLLLTGFMGAGKSTVGRILAGHLGWDFLDLDELVESRAGLSIPEVFAVHGEQQFRKLETQALASALGRNRIVLALGGGVPENLTNRLLIEQTPATAAIFLDAPFPTLVDRCMLQAIATSPEARPESSRPLLADLAAAEDRFLARRPIYRRLARFTVDTSSMTSEDTVAAILESLQFAEHSS